MVTIVVTALPSPFHSNVCTLIPLCDCPMFCAENQFNSCSLIFIYQHFTQKALQQLIPCMRVFWDVYGLLQSSLIMGVHRGCLVLSIVAALLVAVETDVGGTISAAKVAFVCGLWSVRVVALLSAGPSSCFCIHQLLFPCLEVFVQGVSPHHAVSCKVLPGIQC